MAPEHIDRLKQETKNIQEELLPVSRGAVFIKDPKKRRKCPLCNQNIHLYNINYEEMFLMCENSMCEFPFGFEALQVVRNECELQEEPVKATKDFFEYPTVGERTLHQTLDSIIGAPTATLSSRSCLSEFDALSQMGDTDDLPLDNQETATRLPRQDLKRINRQKKDDEVQKIQSRTKELTEKMYKLNEESVCDVNIIKNERWLRILKTWEVETGKKLLKDKENVQLGKNEHLPDENGLKISFDVPGACGARPAVQIQISSMVKEEDRLNRTDSDRKDKNKLKLGDK